MSINERFEGLSEAERVTLLRGLTDVERDAWLANWPEWAHPGQLWPGGAWRTWVMMAGRGFGKTRAGAEWVAALVRVRLWRAGAGRRRGRRAFLAGRAGRGRRARPRRCGADPHRAGGGDHG